MLSLKSKYRTHTCGELTEKNVGEKVVLSGWVHLKWNSKDLDRKLKEGHKYKITSYSSGFGDERIILYVHEIKTSVRKKTGKKSK